MITHFFLSGNAPLKILACINKKNTPKQQQGNHRRISAAVFGVEMKGRIELLLSVLSPNYDIHGCEMEFLKIKKLLSCT